MIHTLKTILKESKEADCYCSSYIAAMINELQQLKKTMEDEQNLWYTDKSEGKIALIEEVLGEKKKETAQEASK